MKVSLIGYKEQVNILHRDKALPVVMVECSSVDDYNQKALEEELKKYFDVKINADKGEYLYLYGLPGEVKEGINGRCVDRVGYSTSEYPTLMQHTPGKYFPEEITCAYLVSAKIGNDNGVEPCQTMWRENIEEKVIEGKVYCRTAIPVADWLNNGADYSYGEWVLQTKSKRVAALFLWVFVATQKPRNTRYAAYKIF